MRRSRTKTARITEPAGTVDAAVETLAFTARWVRYGGADSYEIFMTFGLTPAEFADRLTHALDHPEATVQFTWEPGDRERLEAEAQRMSAMRWPGQSCTRQAQRQTSCP